MQPARITVAELAQRLGGRVEGDGAAQIHGVAPLREAGPGDLSWVGHEKYLPLAAESRAAAVLMPGTWPLPTGKTRICVDDPDLALCRVLELFGPQPCSVPAGIHPTAVVSATARVEGVAIGPHVFVGERAEVGVGTQLHAGAYVGADTRIGRDCVLHANVVVRERVTIGDRVVVHPNSTIGADGFGYLQRDGRHVKIPQIGTVMIADDVEIGANCAVDRARSGATRIGRGTKIDNLVQIGHNCEVGENCIIISQCGLSGSVNIGDQAMLAGQVGIADHVRIGRGAVVAAKSGVMADVPDGGAVIGIPAAERRGQFRVFASLKRLPELIAEVRDLVKRVQRLESATHHSEGS